MANNDQIILDQALEQQRNERAPSVTKSAFFEMYVVEQLLKDYDLSDEEIESGLVGDGGDGGIDGIYVCSQTVNLFKKTSMQRLLKRMLLLK